MIDPIEQIQNTRIDNLRDVDFIVSLIRSYGLHNDPIISDFYGDENKAYLVSNGMLQIPSQLAPALVFLSDKKIKRYIEIGTFNGMTTIFITAYLSRFNPDLETITVDILRKFSNPYKHLNIKAVQGTSKDVKCMNSDLCLIDGDHSYEWVNTDYVNVGKYAKYCMFHDILEDGNVSNREMDVKRFWNSIKKPESIEFIDKGRMGLGIL